MPAFETVAVRLGLLAVAAFAGVQAAEAAQRHGRDLSPTSRVLPWTGGERLGVALSADVRYVQGPAAKVVISGPRDEIDDIVVDHGFLRHDDRHAFWRWWRWNFDDRHVHIVVTAPRITSAGVSGAGRLDLGRLNQDRLDIGVSGAGYAAASGAIRQLHAGVSGSGGVRLTQVAAEATDAWISGSGWVAADGASRELHLTISGSGHADLGRLAVQDVRAVLSGSGVANVAPQQSADVTVSGAGGVRLAREPARLNINRSGAGWVVHDG